MAYIKKRKLFETNELFIEEVRQHSYLYDKDNPDHKNIVLKNTTWTALGAKFGISAEEAAKKWKVQRDRYMKETKKIAKSAALNEVHKLTWKLYPLMDEILCATMKKEPYNNNWTMVNMKEECISGEDEECDTEEFDCSAVSPAIDMYYPEEASFATNSDSAPNCDSFGNNFGKPSTAAMDQRMVMAVNNSTFKEQTVDSFSNPPSILNTILTDRRSNQAVDKVECFCDYLKLRLRLLDKKDQYDAIRMLESIIQDFEGKDKYM